MKIVLAGCTGFIGSHLASRLVSDGHDCTILVRSHQSAGSGAAIAGAKRALYTQMPDVADAVINLAGETVGGYWTHKKKQRILRSRIDTTRQLVTWMQSLDARPSVFICASATGYYGDRGADILTEEAPVDPENSFLADVCLQWEREANEAKELGVRVVNLRTAHVLDPGGGLLAAMTPIFKRAPFIIPFGRHIYMPWISLADEIGMISFALQNDKVSGPLNLAAPTQVTNREFQHCLGAVFSKKVFGDLPLFVIRLALGELAGALLASQRVVPAKMEELGYVFNDRDLREYLRTAFLD